MGAAIAQMIPFALGKMIAVNPTIAVILLLVSAHGRGKAIAYLTGAAIGPMAAGTVLLALVDTAARQQSDDAPVSLSSALQLAIGVTFLALAHRNWSQRAVSTATPPALPSWMQKLDGIGTIGALGLGAAMTVFGVKNLLMLAGVVVVISEADLTFIRQEIVLAAFVAISTLPVAAPLVATSYLGPRADDVLDTWKAWLVRNGALVMLGFLLFLGTYFLFKGLGGLDVAGPN